MSRTAAERTRQCASASAGRGYAPLMVKVHVDADLCVGHGRCYVLAPDVFGADDFGHCVVLEEEVAEALAATRPELGAENCPEQAITIE